MLNLLSSSLLKSLLFTITLSAIFNILLNIKFLRKFFDQPAEDELDLEIIFLLKIFVTIMQ